MSKFVSENSISTKYVTINSFSTTTRDRHVKNATKIHSVVVKTVVKTAKIIKYSVIISDDAIFTFNYDAIQRNI